MIGTHLLLCPPCLCSCRQDLTELSHGHKSQQTAEPKWFTLWHFEGNVTLSGIKHSVLSLRGGFSTGGVTVTGCRQGPWIHAANGTPLCSQKGRQGFFTHIPVCTSSARWRYSSQSLSSLLHSPAPYHHSHLIGEWWENLIGTKRSDRLKSRRGFLHFMEREEVCWEIHPNFKLHSTGLSCVPRLAPESLLHVSQ